jgi:hypothetical protein
VRAIIERAMKNRRTKSEFFRFPNQLCTDKGRAINQQEPGPRGSRLRGVIDDVLGELDWTAGLRLDGKCDLAEVSGVDDLVRVWAREVSSALSVAHVSVKRLLSVTWQSTMRRSLE